MPTVLAVSAHDPRGAGCHADVRTGEALGIPVIAVPTALTVQAPEVVDLRPVEPDYLEEALNRYLPHVDAVKLGAFPDVETAEVAVNALKGFEGPVVLDPVVEASAGGSLCDDDPDDVVGILVEAATVITPNAEELARIAGRRVRTDLEAELAAREITEEDDLTGVLVTGIPYPKVDLWVPAEGEPVAFDVPEGEGAHASGCVLATALACIGASRGVVDEEVVERALMFAREAVSGSLKDPFGPVSSPASRIRRHAALAEAVRDVERAVRVIDGDPDFADAVPQVGINVVRVFDPDSGVEGVVGLSGRIVLEGGVPRAVGRPVPGGSSHVARLVLKAHELDPSVRGGLNIRFDPGFVEAARRLGFDVASFDREKEPEGVSTMEWCVEHVYERVGFVPDVIYDEGGPGKEPMIRILGGSAVEAVSKAEAVVKGR